MKVRLLIFLFFIATFNVFSQWKSFYPSSKLKNKSDAEKDIEKERIKYHSHFFTAVKNRSLENYDKAIENLIECIEINQSESAAFYELALAYVQKKDLVSGKTQIERALGLEPNNKWYLILYAEILNDLFDYKSSAAQYKKLIELEKNNIQFYYSLSEAYLYDNNYLKAIEAYDVIEKERGESKMISLQKYKLYMQINKKKKAIEELLKAEEKNPKDIQILEFLSEAFLLDDEKEKAFEVFKKIALIDPDNGRLHLTLADYYRQSGNNLKSFEELKLAFQSTKLNLDVKAQILVSYFNIIDSNDTILNQAFSLAQLLIESHPENFEPYLIFADLLYADGNYTQAKEQYLIVLQKNKNIRQVWNQLLFLYSQEGDFTELLNISTQALNYFTTEPLIYYFHAVANRNLNKNNEALSSLEDGIEFVFDNDVLLVEFYSVMGDLNNTLTNYKMSDSYYEKALLIDPENAIVLNNYSYYLSLRKEKLNKAKSMSDKCNLIQPNNSTFQDTYAWVLYQLGEYDNAKTWIKKAMTNGGDESPVIVEHYGDILYMLNDISKSIQAWNKAILIGGNKQQLNKKINAAEIDE